MSLGANLQETVNYWRAKRTSRDDAQKAWKKIKASPASLTTPGIELLCGDLLAEKARELQGSVRILQEKVDHLSNALNLPLNGYSLSPAVVMPPNACAMLEVAHQIVSQFSGEKKEARFLMFAKSLRLHVTESIDKRFKKMLVKRSKHRQMAKKPKKSQKKLKPKKLKKKKIPYR